MRTEPLTVHCSPLPGQHAHVFAARNLALLSAIESTVDALRTDTGLITSIERTYDEISEMLISAHEELTDENIRLCLAPVEKAGDTVSRLWCDARDRQKSAHIDPHLQPDDGVAEAWQAFMDALHSLYDKIEEVRDWLEDVRACMEPSTGDVFSDVDALFQSLLQEKSAA